MRKLKTKNKNENIDLKNNYSYYTLLYAIKKLNDLIASNLKVKNQLKRNDLTKINNDMIDFCEYEWLYFLKNSINFLENEPISIKNGINNPKVHQATHITKNLHFKDYYIKYGNCSKSKYKEVTETILFLIEVLSYVNVIHECMFSNKSNMSDTSKDKIISIIDYFYKNIKPIIINILEE